MLSKSNQEQSGKRVGGGSQGRMGRHGVPQRAFTSVSEARCYSTPAIQDRSVDSLLHAAYVSLSVSSGAYESMVIRPLSGRESLRLVGAFQGPSELHYTWHMA